MLRVHDELMLRDSVDSAAGAVAAAASIAWSHEAEQRTPKPAEEKE
jgi:hypothetical protein